MNPFEVFNTMVNTSGMDLSDPSSQTLIPDGMSSLITKNGHMYFMLGIFAYAGDAGEARRSFGGGFVLTRRGNRITNETTKRDSFNLKDALTP